MRERTSIVSNCLFSPVSDRIASLSVQHPRRTRTTLPARRLVLTNPANFPEARFWIASWHSQGGASYFGPAWDEPTAKYMSVPQDVGIAVGQFRRSPGFTITVVLTLALDIGATTAIFNLVYGILLRPLPYLNSEQLDSWLGRSARSITGPIERSFYRASLVASLCFSSAYRTSSRSYLTLHPRVRSMLLPHCKRLLHARIGKKFHANLALDGPSHHTLQVGPPGYLFRRDANL
jgi:hypothetical protein